MNTIDRNNDICNISARNPNFYSNEEILSKSEYLKAEAFLAEKYCINKGNIYRLNNLTKPPKRVIYGVTKEEVEDEGKEDNQNRSIIQITKEN